MPVPNISLPAGVELTALQRNGDDRGDFTEIFRASWPTGAAPVQWNLVRSRPGTLRGFHVHATHTDYLLVAEGAMFLGIMDLRTTSPTAGMVATLTITADEPFAVTLPTGVAHGFCFEKPSTHIYAVSHYWDVADEFACRYDDPEIGIEWPVSSPLLSQRDARAGSLAQMKAAYDARMAELGR